MKKRKNSCAGEPEDPEEAGRVRHGVRRQKALKITGQLKSLQGSIKFTLW